MKFIINKKSLFLSLMILVFNTNAKEYSIYNIEILPESKNHFRFEDILENKIQKFIPYDTNTIPREMDIECWFKFKYTQQSPFKIYYLYSHHMWDKKIELYYKIGDSLYYQKTGNILRFKERSIQSTQLLLKLPNSVDTIQCYLHIKGNNGYWFPFFVHEIEEQNASDFYKNTTESLFFGITFLSIIFSLSFLIYLREKIYLYYILFAIMLIISRSIDDGFIYNYFPLEIIFTKLDYILHIYSFCAMGLTVALFLYMSEFLTLKLISPKSSKIINYLILVRIILWILHILFYNTEFRSTLGSYYVDVCAVIIILLMAIVYFRHNPVLSTLSIVGLLILLGGYLIHIFEITILGFSSPYISYINLTSFEVVFFSIGVAYRHNYLKKENEKSLLYALEKMKESDILKDNINKELEIKVAERTEEIRKMNELLRNHNIELEHEVEDISKARLFQKNMRFSEFQKIFPDNTACLQYLSDIKWKKEDGFKCSKCGYHDFKLNENLSRRCAKCSYIESPIASTLFHNIKFPIQKAFYITYSTSTGTNDLTIESAAKELELRTATYFTFRQKVLSLIEKNKSRKKHKDGWTHLIEYSIEKQ